MLKITLLYRSDNTNQSASAYPSSPINGPRLRTLLRVDDFRSLGEINVGYRGHVELNWGYTSELYRICHVIWY